MRILITAGPTREPIDPVRYVGNRSSGQMGAALAAAARKAGHQVTLIAGPVSITLPTVDRRIDIETTAELHAAVREQFPWHDLLIMVAAVADYRPARVSAEKLDRSAGKLVLELEPTPDIVADVAAGKRSDQRIIGFALESQGNIERARQKLVRKRLDLMVYNPPQTMNSPQISAVLLFPGGRAVEIPRTTKDQFAEILLRRGEGLFVE